MPPVPLCKRSTDMWQKYAEEGYFVLIVGSESHPEVQGIVGWMPNDSYAVISTPQDLEDLALAGEKICIVSQTTFNYNKFQELVEIIRKKGMIYLF